MLVRPTQPEDLPEMARVAARFFKEANLPMRLVPETWVANWTKYLNCGVGVSFASFRTGGDSSQPPVVTGGIGGLRYDDPNDGEPILSEMFWYVLPEERGAGIRLLKAFEDWAAQNVTRLTMAHLHSINSRLGDLYERRGYTKLETHYYKTLREDRPS